MAVVLALVSQKGGTGKSTLARALAAVVAHAGLKVRIADLDPELHTASEWERARTHHRVAPAIEVRAFATPAQALARTAEDELLILDAPGRPGRRALQIAQAADLVVQPCGPSIDDLRPAVLFFHELADAGVARDRLVVALCRTLTREEEDAARRYLDKSGYAVLAGSIPERAAYRDAHGRGEALTEARRRARDEQVDRLIEALFEKVHALMFAKAKSAAGTKEKRA